ncbi:MAG: aminotransferase class V-fold PLP-dependent enzyme, partial [Fusicatenibacter sp.]
PFGTGFVYVRREVIPLLTPRWYSDSNLQVNEEDLPGMETLPVFSHREGILRLSGGSRNTYGITSMGKSVELLLEIGIDRIHEQVMGLERYFRNRIREEELPLSFLGSEQEEHWSGNICMEFASEKTQQLMEELEKRKIYARVSEGYLRLGLHYYNTQEHLERAVEALQRIFQTVPCR